MRHEVVLAFKICWECFDIGGDGATTPILRMSGALGASLSRAKFAGYTYISLYGSGYPTLFTIASVFVGPALLSSLLAVGFKVWLLTRRVSQKKALAAQRSNQMASKRQLRKCLLHMLAARFVLQRDTNEYEEAKLANDRDRYEGYGYMLGIFTEASQLSHAVVTVGVPASFQPRAEVRSRITGPIGHAGCSVWCRERLLSGRHRQRQLIAAAVLERELR
jgi:hypothetical protein